MSAKIEDLEAAVRRAVQSTSLRSAVQGFEVEPSLDDAGAEFLRVKLFVKYPEGNVDAELEGLLEQIEFLVAEIEDRYPSVRFLDAA